MPTTFGDYESVAGEHHRHMVVPARITTPFIMVEPELSFQILIGPLDAPALHDEAHELLCRGRHFGHGHKEVIRWLGLIVAPFDEQRRLFVVSYLYAEASKPGRHGATRALPPGAAARRTLLL